MKEEYSTTYYCVSIAISSTCILVTTLLWSLFKWVWLNPKKIEKILRDQGFQGNPYKLYYGDSNEMREMIMDAISKPMSHFSNDILSRAKPFYRHTLTNYGEKCFMWYGPVAMVNIRESEAIKEICMKINEFQKPQANAYFKVMASGLVDLEGHAWVKRRKLLNPAFHVEKLKLMLPAFKASTSNMIQKWEELALKTGSCEVDVWLEFYKLSADAISKAAFSSSFEEGRKIFELITQQIKLATPLLTSVYIPGWRFLPTKINRRINQTQSEIKSLLKGIIIKRQMEISSGDNTKKDDLLGVLLESCNSDVIHNKKKHDLGIHLDDVISECKIFYLAGQETTSTLLTWTLILLAKYPDWQARARAEVLAAFGPNNSPDFHSLNHLKMVNMILQEALRLYPPIPELQRTVREDMKVGDIFLPAGVLVTIPVLDVQHDEKLWGSDAQEFNPSRFSEGISKAANGYTSFFAFGWGPRICIGSNFAMTESKLALVSILQRFTFELSPSYVHAPVAIAIIGTFQPQFGAPIIFNKISS